MEYFALFVLIVIAAVGIWLTVLLGNLPGNIADNAGHPQAEAIRLLGWFGLLSLGVGWFLAIIWARYKPEPDKLELLARIEQLEARLAATGSEP
ncbi:MAG: DUF3302 domain-containing protein [Pseudomonadota bacterium]